MRQSTRSYIWITIAALALVLAPGGCGGGGNGDSKPIVPTTAEEFTARGWERFEAGDIGGALSDFDDALDIDSGHGPAYLGLGWARLGLATSTASMGLAAASFDSAGAHGVAEEEFLSGRAAAHLGMGGNPNYISAIEDAMLALQLAPDFTFAHRGSFNATDLKLVRAFAFAAQGHIPAALSAADEVMDSGIEDGLPGTWVVDGTSYGSFDGAVLAFLYKLSEEYAG
jgi:tetratricopeptide (TPR) repeat protein